MSNLFTAQDADGVSDTVVRQDHEVKSGLFEYTKTGAGTATLELKSLFSGAALITVALRPARGRADRGTPAGHACVVLRVILIVFLRRQKA